MEEGFYTPLTEKKVKIEKEVENKIEPECRQLEVEEFSYFRFSMFFIGIAIISLLVYGLYLVNEGKLQSNINQPINTNTVLNNTVSNSYSFNPSTNNQYQLNFNVTLEMPNTIIIRSNNT